MQNLLNNSVKNIAADGTPPSWWQTAHRGVAVSSQSQRKIKLEIIRALALNAGWKHGVPSERQIL